MTATIEPFYSYGQRVITPDHVEALAQRIIDAAGGSGRERLAYHAEGLSFIWGDGYAEWRLVIFDVWTGYDADILDYSNAAAVCEIHTGESEAIDLDSSGTRTMLFVPLTNDVEALLFPAEPDEDEQTAAEEALAAIADALDRASSFADYPVLDEQDYSEREMKAWDESFDSEYGYLDLPDEDREAVYEKVMEHWGESDPGWVNPDWITEAHAEALVEKGASA